MADVLLELRELQSKVVFLWGSMESFEEAWREKFELEQGEVLCDDARGVPDEVVPEASQGVALSVDLAESFLREASTALLFFDELEIRIWDSDSYKNYVSHIYAMKIALANIREHELSAVAGVLEQAGRDKDTEQIKSDTNHFVEQLRKLVATHTPDYSENTVDENPEFLRKQLKAIQVACEGYNSESNVENTIENAIENAEAILSDLRKRPCSKETGILLSEIAAHMLHGDFDEAAALVSEFVKKGKS